MRLYATITSERATKGQGGNKFLEIDIKIIDRELPKYIVRVENEVIEVFNAQRELLFIDGSKKS